MLGIRKRGVPGCVKGGFLYLRVDDRLIHGQVVVGWGSPLDVNCLLLANDAVAADAGQKALYLEIIPEEMGGSILRLDQAIASVPDIRRQNLRCLAVVSSINDAVKWVESEHPPDLLILGGVHQSLGRRRILDYVCLTGAEIEKLRSLQSRHFEILCQDVWSSAAVSFDDALKRAG
jgi:mannose/fructose/N-acetylgalactosamine-specific phosphotransferase system component IIB